MYEMVMREFALFYVEGHGVTPPFLPQLKEWLEGEPEMAAYGISKVTYEMAETCSKYISACTITTPMYV